MEFINRLFGHLQQLADGHYAPSSLLITAILFLTVLVVLTARSQAVGEPQTLWDPVPFVFNTLQFVTNNDRFMQRVSYVLFIYHTFRVDSISVIQGCNSNYQLSGYRKILKNVNLAKFYLGATPVYLLAGPRNIQTIFGRSNKLGTEDIMVQNVLPKLFRMNKDEVKRFADDKTGRGRVPAPGTESTPAEQRYWLAFEHVHTEFLARTQHLKPIVESFCRQFSQALEKFPAGEWTTLSVRDLCRGEVTECAISTLFGPGIFELNPGFVDAFWEFDQNVFAITLGLPAWMNPRPYRIHDRYLAMIGKYVDAAWARFDWDGPNAEAFWEPHFGARVCREIAKWLRGAGFRKEAVAGALGVLLFA
jgi:hypothetical protein